MLKEIDLTKDILEYFGIPNRRTPGGRALEVRSVLYCKIRYDKVVSDYLKPNGDIDCDLLVADTCKELTRQFPKFINEIIRNGSKKPVWKLLFAELRPNAQEMLDGLVIELLMDKPEYEDIATRAKDRMAALDAEAQRIKRVTRLIRRARAKQKAEAA